MAIEDILRSLDEQADQDGRVLMDNAKEQAKNIVAEARAEADRVRDAKVAATKVQVHSRAAQIVNAAKLERRRQIAVAQDAGFAQVYADAGAVMSRTRGTKEYEALFRALAEEATDRVTGDLVVQVAPDDAALAARVMSDLGFNAEIDASAEILGGLTVISSGGRVYRRNTLDDRLVKARKHIQSTVAEILYA
jgi:V/A-type H+-transporting ATPase subunit E